MRAADVRRLLEAVKEGSVDVDGALAELAELPFADLLHTRVDHHRALRTGAAEVVYAEGKTAAQVAEILAAIAARGETALATRVSAEQAELVRQALPEVRHHPEARALLLGALPTETIGQALIVCAGTSDLPVAEEAALTARVQGLAVARLTDVGVAGLHRIAGEKAALDAANVVIVIAGMEGALASVVAGLTRAPVVAVPTSVGYGANFAGLAALLGMLSGCASGVAVVNVDNGFGAAMVAARIARAKGSP